MNGTTLLGALLAAAALPPALDAFGRWVRLAGWRGAAEFTPAEPKAFLVLIPARAEGTRVIELCRDLKREAGLVPSIRVETLAVLDGGDPSAEAALRAEGFDFLVKGEAGPSKGAALAFATAELEKKRGAAFAVDYVLVFDADMRLPGGWLRDLKIPWGADAFQAPVRPAGTPPPGAPRVEALSLAVATLVEDLVRDGEELPVRLRGKAMGFTPDAWRLGPAAATRTMAEDSEATLALLLHEMRVRALPGPLAYDEPVAGEEAMIGPRARWFGGHLKLLAAYRKELVAFARTNPRAAGVLFADLFLRPRSLVLLGLAGIFAVSSILFICLLFTGVEAGDVWALNAAVFSGLALLAERDYVRRARAILGTPPEVPPVTPEDLLDAARVWIRSIARALKQPERWHRARPEAVPEPPPLPPSARPPAP